MQGSPSTTFRDPWLDLLRATAIVLVVAYHTIQWSPGIVGWSFGQYGNLGVDLFFVLSGWLIGGLYWREHSRGGRVEVWKFWKRRWWRTLPGYAVALLLAFTAVRVMRGERFDAAYLFFGQNYQRQIPFFTVSWSLCIEEHFYLFVPLLLAAVGGKRGIADGVSVSLIAGAVIARRAAAPVGALTDDFGYYLTATHLRLDGLVLGFWASRWLTSDLTLATRARSLARVAVVPLFVALFWTLRHASATQRYVLLPLVAALFFLALLVANAGTKRVLDTARGVVYWIALTAYSVYLTHALAIHVARVVCARIGDTLFVHYVVTMPLIVGAGAAFFFLVERPSLRLRERLVPK